MPTVHCLPRKFFRRRGVEPPFRWGQGAPGHVPVTPCNVSLPSSRGGGSPRKTVGNNKRGRPADEGRARQGGAKGGKWKKKDGWIDDSDYEEEEDEFVADSDEDFDVESESGGEEDRWDSDMEDDDDDGDVGKKDKKKGGKNSAPLSRVDQVSQEDDDSEESPMPPPRGPRGKHHGKKVDMTVGSDIDSSGALMDDIYPSAGKSKKAAKNAQSPINLESDASDDLSTSLSQRKKPKLSRYFSNAREEKNEEDERPPLPPINFPADESSIAGVVAAGGDDQEAVDAAGEGHADDVSPKPGSADPPTKPKRSAKKTFEQRLEELRAYQEEHGHLRVSKKENPSLASFCANVRYARKHPETGSTKLSDDRIAALDALGFTWEPRKKVTGKVADRRSFEEYLDDLRAYHQKHGHVNVEVLENKALVNFCKQVRHSRRHPEKAMIKLTDERIDLLNLLGFDWSVKDHDETSSCGPSAGGRKSSFFEFVAQLRAYKEEHGHIDVTVSENKRLARFCYAVRTARKNQATARFRLGNEHIKALDDLGFQWGSRFVDSFSKRLNELREFKEDHGHLLVSNRHYKSLVVFCSKVRRARYDPEFKGLKLTKERIAALDEIGFEWKRRTLKSFAERIEDLRSYKKKHGHLNVKQKEDPSLFRFCSNVKYARSNPGKKTITEERIAALDAIGFKWSAPRRSTISESAREEVTMKRIACGECEGCKRKACRECDACTGSPKKRCTRRVCSKTMWVEKEEYEAWKASGKSTPKPAPKSNGLSEREGCTKLLSNNEPNFWNALGFDEKEELRSPVGGERLSGTQLNDQEVATFSPDGSGDAAPEERINEGEPSAVKTAGVLANHIIESKLQLEPEVTNSPRVQQDVLSADEDWGDDEDGMLSGYGFLGCL